jgi:hypothetical protein
MVLRIAGTQIEKGATVKGLGNELHPPQDCHRQAVGLRGDAEGSRSRGGNAAVSPPSAGRHAPKESKPGFWPFTHILKRASAV